MQVSTVGWSFPRATRDAPHARFSSLHGEPVVAAFRYSAVSHSARRGQRGLGKESLEIHGRGVDGIAEPLNGELKLLPLLLTMGLDLVFLSTRRVRIEALHGIH